MAVRRLAEVQPDHFDFTPENRAWVDRQIRKYPPGRQASAVMALLRRAQVQHDGWLPKPAIEKVAEILDMPSIRVLEVATFYTMYNLAPVGRYFVQFCGTTPCVLRGADGIKKVLEDRIGPQNHVTPDGMFSWLEVECLGACCTAPMVQINDDYYEDLTPENFSTLLDELAAGKAVKPGSQMGRVTSEPFGELTSLTAFYGKDGKADSFKTEPRPDDEAVLTAANDDPAMDALVRAHERASHPAETAGQPDASQGGSTTDGDAGDAGKQRTVGAPPPAEADVGQGGLGAQRELGNARPEGSVAGTGTRTDDPVGTGKEESSAIHKMHETSASDRQERPPVPDGSADRGQTGPGSPPAGPHTADDEKK